MKGTLLILFFFGTGLILGILHLLPEACASYGIYVLCLLMFCVGISIGHQPGVLRRFTRIDRRILLLPFTTIAGTFAGIICIKIFFKHSLTDTLAISSGFGYYSLSSILITQYKGIEAGTIALLSNIFREMITLIFAPAICRYFGPLAPIAAGGATSIDTSLPVIVQNSGSEFGIISIYSGFIVDLSVPFLVTFWCMF